MNLTRLRNLGMRCHRGRTMPAAASTATRHASSRRLAPQRPVTTVHSPDGASTRWLVDSAGPGQAPRKNRQQPAGGAIPRPGSDYFSSLLYSYVTVQVSRRVLDLVTRV